MIQINCPFCGRRDHSEFSYGRDGSIEYPELDACEEDWHDAIFMRENIYGIQTETWQHLYGCRLWLYIDRDTRTHEISGVRLANQNWDKALRSSK